MKRKKVLVFGIFDWLHEGHLDFFHQAKKHGDFLIVVVGRDSTVQRMKNRLPKYNEKERFKAVKNCGLANEVRLGNDGHDPRFDSYDIIKEINPDVVCLGYDQAIFLNKLEAELKRINLSPKIKVLKPYKPEIYHSSFLNKKF